MPPSFFRLPVPGVRAAHSCICSKSKINIVQMKFIFPKPNNPSILPSSSEPCRFDSLFVFVVVFVLAVDLVTCDDVVDIGESFAFAGGTNVVGGFLFASFAPATDFRKSK